MTLCQPEPGVSGVLDRPGHGFAAWVPHRTGPREQVGKVAVFFGLNYWTGEGQIVNPLASALIARDGKVDQFYPGNDWQLAQVVIDLRDLRRTMK